MDRSSVDMFLELKDYNGQVVAGESGDATFGKLKAIEITSFSISGDSAESRSSPEESGDDEATEGDGRPGAGPSWVEDGPLGAAVRTSSAFSAAPTAEAEPTPGPYCKFDIGKILDKSSPSLMVAYCWTLSSRSAVQEGERRYASARISVRKAGGGQRRYLIYTFEDVSVISYALDASNETPTETMSFKFEKFSMAYSRQTETGTTASGMLTTSWDFNNPPSS